MIEPPANPLISSFFQDSDYYSQYDYGYSYGYGDGNGNGDGDSSKSAVSI